MSLVYRSSNKQMRGFLDGMILSPNSGTPTTAIDVSAGSCMDSTNSQLIVFPLTNASIKINLNWAGGGNLDTGAVGAFLTYHVFAIMAPDGKLWNVLFSLSPTAPTMPTGYTFFRRVGSVVTDGSSTIRPFTQNGNEFLYNPGYDVATAVISTSGTTFSITGMPAGSGAVTYISKFIPTINSYNNNQGNAVNFCSVGQTMATPSVYGITPTSTSMKQAYTVAGGSVGEGSADCQNPTTVVQIATSNGQFVGRASGLATSLNCYMLGWTDFRGKQ